MTSFTFSEIGHHVYMIRGCRSSSAYPLKGHIPASVDLALGEGRLSPFFFFTVD